MTVPDRLTDIVLVLTIAAGVLTLMNAAMLLAAQRANVARQLPVLRWLLITVALAVAWVLIR